MINTQLKQSVYSLNNRTIFYDDIYYRPLQKNKRYNKKNECVENKIKKKNIALYSILLFNKFKKKKENTVQFNYVLLVLMKSSDMTPNTNSYKYNVLKKI